MSAQRDAKFRMGPGRRASPGAARVARLTVAVCAVAFAALAGCAGAPAEGCGANGYIHAYWEVLECQALAGNQLSALQLAQMFDSGEGVPQDFKKAARYYMIAATPRSGTVPIYVPPVGVEHFGHTTSVRLGDQTNGIPDAQLALAQMYADGRGVERNAGKARWWAQRALEGGAPGAAEIIARLGRGVR